ncbi:MAG: membrane protein insertase YidC [Endomicrobium sp.]|nr:membrane protein insertase YidC [Endomicrobium sp.]
MRINNIFCTLLLFSFFFLSNHSFANNLILNNSNGISNRQKIYDQESFITIEQTNYKIVFTNKGAAIKSWAIRENNGHWLELLNPHLTNFISNFEDCIYKIIFSSNNKICFEYVSPKGWRIVKTYYLSSCGNMHNVTFVIDRIKPNIQLPTLELNFNSLNILNNKSEINHGNTSKILICSQVKPNNVKLLKYSKVLYGSLYKWIAFSNRYFVFALIPNKSSDFDQINIIKNVKPLHYHIKFKANNTLNKYNYSVNFFVGPKLYKSLKSYNLNLEKVIDFGFFSFLGKPIFLILLSLHKLTNNYGWAIILLTIIMQLLMLPLTLKSFKSLITMKHIQPKIQNIQQQYSDNSKQMQMEILNIYKTQQINPLSGCLPTLLQLPIFWAFFTILRNVYELHNESWILWIRDLSSPDKLINIGNFYINALPIIMGIIMFAQQKITSTTSDLSSYKKMMYIMPMLFTAMFWSFPSGVIIYWIINSIFSLLEQCYILKKNSSGRDGRAA